MKLKLSVIFDPMPPKWGLRGDPYFWEYLQGLAEDMDTVSPDELDRWIRETHLALSGEDMTADSIARVEQFAHGGMSSGRISGLWWTETAIPLLCSRLSDGSQPCSCSESE